jgi:hypothetical protein
MTRYGALAALLLTIVLVPATAVAQISFPKTGFLVGMPQVLCTEPAQRPTVVTITAGARLGFTGPFDFDVHPTNLGHTFIASQFEQAWRSLN